MLCTPSEKMAYQSEKKCTMLPKMPIKSQLSLQKDGSVALAVINPKGSLSSWTKYNVILGTPSSSKVVVSRTSPDLIEEASVSTGGKSSAYVHTILRTNIKDRTVEKVVITEYASRTVRVDRYTVASKGSISRTTQWNYANGTQINATYQAASRILASSKNGREASRFLTQGTSTTSNLDGAANNSITIIGDKTIGPGSSTTVIGPTTKNGPVSYSTITKDTDGNTTVTQVTPLDSGGVVAGTLVTTSGGTISADGTITITNANGQTTVASVSNQTSQDGPTQTVSTSVSSTTPGGGFSSYSETSTNGDVTQRSSSAVDGDGNESMSTVTYNNDGTFSLTVTTKGSDGTETSDSHTYDKNGNEVPPSDGSGNTGGNENGPGTGGDTSGDGTGAGSGGNDDGEECGGDGTGSSGGGEYPSDDGTDASPPPSFPTPADVTLTNYMSNISSFLNGAPPGVHVPIGGGDPPIDSIASSIDSSASSSNPEGALSSLVDLRPFTGATLTQADPDLNPRAVVGALGALAGRSAANIAVAIKAVGALERVV
ncbi:hypothetical protein V500_10640 [Pseudogymnoascus sp. VKM F-4518 (FW-2643)]|nr:hypothetical protein V500_10640 [Pseudogymnoascus sp. VKM F-4518 (FW-2643)]